MSICTSCEEEIEGVPDKCLYCENLLCNNCHSGCARCRDCEALQGTPNDPAKEGEGLDPGVELTIRAEDLEAARERLIDELAHAQWDDEGGAE